MLSAPLDRYAKTRDAEAFAEIVHEYQSLVLATCRRKLANPADVDDAVQETFLRLARKASHLHSNLGAWLHRCAVNVSIDINRRRRARAEYESAAASPAVRDDPQRQLADLREHLDDALAKLPAADRELIIERFFVGTPQIDIAARAGVTPSTITHRLQKAIESLRRHLGSMGCAAAAAGAAALAENLHAEHASAAVEKGLTSNLMKIGLTGVAGTSAMPLAAILIAAAILVLLGLASWFAWDQISAPGSPVAQFPPQASVPASAPSAFTVNANQPATAIPPVWQQPSPAAQSGVLSGRVTDAAGNPVPGAQVQIVGGGAPTTTDSQGYYNFRALRRGRSGTYQLSVLARGFVSLGDSNNTPTIQLSPTSRARRDFVLQKGQQIKVLVTDSQGKRLAPEDIAVLPFGQLLGTRVRPDPQDRSDHSGTSSYTLPLNQGQFVVFASLESFAPARQVITPASADKPLDVTLIMQPGLSIKGVAICSDHKPAAGYTISAQPDWWTGNGILSRTQIDAAGNFTLTGLAPGENVLYVWGESSGRQIGTLQMPPTTQPITLNVPMPSLGSLVTVSGKIQLSGGRLSRDMLSVDFTSLENQERYSAWAQNIPRSHTEMQYSLKLPPGAYQLSIDAEDITPFQIDRVQVPGNLPLITLQIINQPRLTGTVTDPTGNPVTNFAVRVRKFETLGDGLNYSQDPQWTQVDDPGGKFSVECVGPGIYSLQISTRDYAWQWTPKVRLEENQRVRDIPIRLTPGGSLAGIVTDSSGNPVTGAKVIPLSMAVSTDFPMQENFEGETGAVVTDATGHFLLPHLQPGTETLKIVHTDFSPLIVPGFALAEGKQTDAGTISLHAGGTVEGTVYDDKGQPVPHASLLIQDSDDQITFMDARVKAHRVLAVTADEQGRYRAPHLPTKCLWVNLAGGQDLQGVAFRVVRPVDGRTARLDFGGPVPTIRGRLVKDGNPFAYQNLLLTTQSFYGTPFEAKCASDANGFFNFFGAPPGPYHLFFLSGSRRDWVPIHRIDLTAQPQDLGAIDCDQGDVVLRLTFDDPALASSRRTVVVSTPWPNGLLWARMLDFDNEGDHLRATGVPAQNLIISAAFFDDGNLLFTSPFQRIAGTAETSLTMRIPKSSATLRLIDTSAPSGKEPFPIRFDLQSEDGSTHCEMGLWDSATDKIPLPPGRYYFSYPMGSLVPIPGLPHFTMTAGQTTEIRTDFSPAHFRHVNVAVWSSTGTPITSPPPQVFDGNNQLPPCDVPRIGTLFFLRPGNYRLAMPLSGGSSFSQQITVPPLSPGQGPWTEVPIDVVLPQ